MEKPINKHKKIVISIIISFTSLLIIYLGMSIYFMNHFYFGATINCINVSGKTVENVNKQMTDKIETYTLELEGRGGVKETISAADIGLKYNSHNKIQGLKDAQNSFQWILGAFNEKQYKLSDIALYDEKLLKECVNNLSYFNSSNIIKPKSASFKYTGKSYEIINEVAGNEINKDILYKKIVNAILKEETKISLNAIDCYKAPKYTSNSKEVITTKDTLNKYVASIITYDSEKRPEILDGSTINTWLTVDENLEIKFDNEKVRDYVNTLACTYDTFGRTRSFVTSSGRTVKVSGGDYGWLVNRSKEVQDLIKTIKGGKTITKEPIYAQTALSHGINDIGKTYVEIDLTKQYLWFYKNKSLIAEGNVVTGNISSNHSTPQGTYDLNYKQKNAVLKGADYSAPVSFWMPFNGGIGIHDANWRTSFGGKIYKTNGSHGCVNAPYDVAKAIFYNIEPGTPVICHF
jgi:hypothetical protein